VTKAFFSPQNRTYDNLRMLSERRSISYSLFVKIFAEGAPPTLPGLSVSILDKHERGRQTEEFGECGLV